jgi:hypothetical protein
MIKPNNRCQVIDKRNVTKGGNTYPGWKYVTFHLAAYHPGPVLAIYS